MPRRAVATVTTDARPEPSGTTARVAAVLDAVVFRGEVGVRELAAALGISRSATHRIAQVLARLRVLHALPSGRYEPGARLLAWAGSLAARDPMLVAADDTVGEMARELNETAYLLGYRPGAREAVVLRVWPGSRPIRYALPVGAMLPLHAGAAGKAILAWLDDPPDAQGPAITESTLTGAALDADLAATRERGYALSVGERIAQAAGAAAPLFRDGQVVGAVGFTIPRQRLAETDMSALGELARDAAGRIGMAFGSAPMAPARAAARRGLRESDASGASGRDVARVVEIIDALASSPERGVAPAELGHGRSITPAIASSTLARLAEAGVARRNAGGRYQPDVVLLAWSGRLPDHGVVRVARDLVRELVAEVDETVCLLRFDAERREARFDLCEECSQPIQYIVPLGTLVPLHAGASGKAILAQLPRGDWPAPPLEAFSERTITSLEDLEDEIARVREQGFATSVGEHLVDAAGIAVPFFVDRAIAGALAITMPAYRFDDARVPELAARLQRYCAELTDLLSVPATPRP